MTDDIRRLCKNIEDGTQEDAWEAAKRLESTVNDTVSFLLRVMVDGKETGTRAAAAYVLGFCRFASARVSLEEILDNVREDPFVRGHAAESLAYIGDPRSTDLLLRHLHDSNLGVRYWCTFALGQTGTMQAVSALKRMAESPGDEFYEGRSLRKEALAAVSEIEKRTKGHS
jgi:HEAT repeat protein